MIGLIDLDNNGGGSGPDYVWRGGSGPSQSVAIEPGDGGPGDGPVSAPGQLEDTQPWQYRPNETNCIVMGADGVTHEQLCSSLAPTTPPEPAPVDPNILGPGNTVADLFDRLFNNPDGGGTLVTGGGEGSMTWVPGATASGGGVSGIFVLAVVGIAVVAYVLWSKMKGGAAHV